MRSLQPPLDAVPEGDWFCPRCAAAIGQAYDSSRGAGPAAAPRPEARGTPSPQPETRPAEAQEELARARAKSQRRVAVRSAPPLRSTEDEAEAVEATACATCGSAEDAPGSNDILLCDACDAGHHMRSLTLTLTLSLTLSLTSTLTLTRLPHALPAAAARCGARGRLVLPAVRATDGEPRRR